MSEAPQLKGAIGEVRMTLEITRAATGETEVVELIGKVLADAEEQNDD